MNLLLIEDDIEVADVLARAFREEGHVTTVTHSGEAGLASLARQRPDAVLLDVRMPTMNGIEVLRRIRAIDQALPVIIITGLATPSEIAKAREPWGDGSDREVVRSQKLQRVTGAGDEPSASVELGWQVQPASSVPLSLHHHMKCLVEEVVGPRGGFRIGGSTRAPQVHLEPSCQTVDNRRKAGDVRVDEHQGEARRIPAGDDVGRTDQRRDSLGENGHDGLFLFGTSPIGGDAGDGHAVAQPLSLLNFHVDETPKAAAIDHPSTTLGRRPDFRILTDAYVRYPHEPEPKCNCLAMVPRAKNAYNPRRWPWWLRQAGVRTYAKV